MQIWSLSHRYSCRYIVYDAGFEEQCQTFNYTSPESPTNHFSVNLNTWSRPNLNKEIGSHVMQIWSLSQSSLMQIYCIRRRLRRTMSNFQLYLTRIAHESFFRQPQYMITSKIWIRKWWSRHANHVSIASVIHAGILYTTHALKNHVKLSIIPHPNRPRIIFPSTSIHGHVQIRIRNW